MGRYGSIEVDVTASAVHVTLRGEIDAGLADDIRRALELGDPQGSWVEVDASRVTFMDCFGLRALAWLAGRARGVVVLDPPRIIRFLLETTDLPGVNVVERQPVGEPPSRPGTQPV